MEELIKREDAIEAMAELQGIAQSKAELTGISKAWKRIKVLPTVDAVQVVRCRECKRWGCPIPIEMKDEGYGYCNAFWSNTHENEYCAWGERRE